MARSCSSRSVMSANWPMWLRTVATSNAGRVLWGGFVDSGGAVAAAVI